MKLNLKSTKKIALGLLILVLLACGSKKNPETGQPPSEGNPVGTVSDPSPFANRPMTSDRLIEDAVAAGNISLEQGWRYRIAARFNPGALPPAFTPPQTPGASPNPETAGADSFLNSLASTLPTLNAEAQREMVAYLIPPIYAGTALPHPQHLRKTGATAIRQQNGKSIQASDAPGPLPQAGWQTKEGAKIKIWWQENTPGDEGMADLIISLFPSVQTDLDAITGKKIISDAGVHSFIDKNGEEVTWGDGGNEKLDIYLVNMPPKSYAMTVPFLPGCSERPSFILINRNTGLDPLYLLRAALPHEYMHVLQNAFKRGPDCPAYTNVDEGTATWASQHLFPDNDWEREHYADWYPFGDFSLAAYNYETWPFYLFMAQVHTPNSIRQIFEGYASLTGMAAVNAALPGGLEQQWPEYTVREWNQTEIADDFRDWDHWNQVPWRLKDIPIERVPVVPDSRGSFEYRGRAELDPLTRKYFHFAFDHSAIRAIGISAALRPATKGHLKALIKKTGQSWVTEDWTAKKASVEYCRDLEDEKIEELVLIYSNADFPSGGAGGAQRIQEAFVLTATNIACKTLRGTFTTNATYGDSSRTEHWEISTTADFERDGTRNADGNLIGKFIPIQGTGSYNYTGSIRSGNDLCTCTTSGSFQVNRDPQSGIGLAPYYNRFYIGGLGTLTPQTFEVTFICPFPKPSITSITALSLIWGTPGLQEAAANGNLTGSGSIGPTNMTWDIRPKP